MKEKFVLANDIGGTHITSAIIDTTTWRIQKEHSIRKAIHSQADKCTIISDWAQAMKTCLEKSKINKPVIGIAMPGPFDYENGISLMQGQNKYDALYKVNVKEALSQALGNPDIRFINDAAAFLQGEVFHNQLTTKSRILGITLGTGLGSAVWKKGLKAFDADLWDTPYKGKIFEEYMVTRFLVNRFEELTGKKERGFKEIIEKHKNTAEFTILINEYAEHIADFLYFFSEKYQSKHFIIGGSISKAWDIITEGRAELFAPYEINIGEIGEEAALIGAGTLFE